MIQIPFGNGRPQKDMPPNTWWNGFGGNRIRSMKHLFSVSVHGVHDQAHLTKLQRPQKSSADWWRTHGNPSKMSLKQQKCIYIQYIPIPVWFPFRFHCIESIPVANDKQQKKKRASWASNSTSMNGGSTENSCCIQLTYFQGSKDFPFPGPLSWLLLFLFWKNSASSLRTKTRMIKMQN